MPGASRASSLPRGALALFLALGLFAPGQATGLLRAPLLSLAPKNPELDPKGDAEKEHIREYSLKAAFLHHFFKYTTWPEEAPEKDPPPFELWVVGDDPFGDLLEKTFKDKVLQGRSVRITRKESVPDKIDAHFVFAGGMREAERALLIERCKDKPTLLMGESKDFAISGADANFYIEDSRVRFQINTDAIEASGLTISSELLKLATIVKTKEKEASQ